MTKYKGIDSRTIKCCSDDVNSIEAGISFDEQDGVPLLNFHFLKYLDSSKSQLTQVSKTMHLNKENTMELIKNLQELNFD